MAKIILNQSRIVNLNDSRKRPIQPAQWKDDLVKVRRNSGEPYIGRTNNPTPGKAAPTMTKVCAVRCQYEGCVLLTLRQKQSLFEEYWGEGEYKIQRSYLRALLEHEVTAGGTVFMYHIKLNGKNRRVCKNTFMDIFQISKHQVKTVQDKALANINFVSDGRGTHQNHPTLPPQTIPLIDAHIQSFPKYEKHYSKAKLDDCYLSSDLTLDRMFEAFVQAHQNLLPHPRTHENLYRRRFRASGLTIGEPKSDTCKVCDKIQVDLTVARRYNNQNLIQEQKGERLWHLDVVDFAKKQLDHDVGRSRNDPNYAVICIDLQQVLFCPTLSHSDIFYQRQLSTYNFCINTTADDNGTMCLWNETVARRGVDELCSSIFLFVTRKFPRLRNQQQRSLVIWADRCRGQNNNFPLICFSKYLIKLRYFTEIEIKFLQTGHSYMTPDRYFGQIELRKKTVPVMIPDEWAPLIQSTCPNKPFRIQQMIQRDFWNVKRLEDFIPRPRSLKVTEWTWFLVSAATPAVVETRVDFLPVRWWTQHLLHRPNARGRIARRPPWGPQCLNGFNRLRKYNHALPITREKYDDLQTMLPFLMPEYHRFYQNLNHF